MNLCPRCGIPLTEGTADSLSLHMCSPSQTPAGGQKHDGGKRRTDLLPVRALLDVADVLTFGAKKYGDRNWEKGMAWSRVYGALLRHLWAWWLGEDKDPESGLQHLAHAACCVLFLLTFADTHKEHDDRPRDHDDRS